MEAAQIKVVSVQSGDWEIDKGNKVAAVDAQANTRKLKALLAGNDSMALGVVSAVRAAGKTGQVQVVGYDNINAIKPMLADGRVLATPDQFAASRAVFGIEAALKISQGRESRQRMPMTSSRPRSSWLPKSSPLATQRRSPVRASHGSFMSVATRTLSFRSAGWARPTPNRCSAEHRPDASAR